MKVVFAIKSMNSVGGGAERVLADVANALIGRGHSISVVSFDGEGRSFYPLDPRIIRLNLDISPPGVTTPRLAVAKALPRLRAAVVGQAPDLAVGFMHSMYVPLTMALFGSSIPVFASEHIGRQYYEDRAIDRWLVRLLSSRFAAKSVPSEVIRADCLASDSCPLHVLPNPLSLEQFERGSASQPACPPVLLAVGRFAKQKNHSELIDAFSRVADDFPSWILRFVGEGELRSDLERRVAELNLQSRVQMPGTVREMAEEYAAASVVAMPSLWESFGLATAEALASRRPVIGFVDCPGTNELIVDGENGLLVEGGCDRVEHLASGLRRLMSDADLRNRLGSAGPASVSRFHGYHVTPIWESVLAKYAKSDPLPNNGVIS